MLDNEELLDPALFPYSDEIILVSPDEDWPAAGAKVVAGPVLGLLKSDKILVSDPAFELAVFVFPGCLYIAISMSFMLDDEPAFGFCKSDSSKLAELLGLDAPLLDCVVETFGLLISDNRFIILFELLVPVFEDCGRLNSERAEFVFELVP